MHAYDKGIRAILVSTPRGDRPNLVPTGSPSPVVA